MKRKPSKKKVIYTCLTGKYDELSNHQYTDEAWEYVCFSDTVTPSSANSTWRIIPLERKDLDDQKTNRWHKINPHLCVAEYEKSIYIDANIDVVDKDFFDEISNHENSRSIFSIMNHSERDCAYQEAEACIALGKDDPVVLRRHINTYKKKSYPEHNGLYTSSILYREHNNKELIAVMEEWWNQLKINSRRDQVSLPYVLWVKKFVPNVLNFSYGIGRVGPLFYYPHLSDSRHFMRDLFNQVTDLKSRLEVSQDKVQLLESRIDLIERSVVWRTRNKIARLIRR